MRVSIAGQYQGETDQKTARETKGKYPNTKIVGRCIICNHQQEIKTFADSCKKCEGTNWK